MGSGWERVRKDDGVYMSKSTADVSMKTIKWMILYWTPTKPNAALSGWALSKWMLIFAMIVAVSTETEVF